MEPNFHNGDYLIVDEFSYHFRDPQRGEVVVFKYPNNPSQRYIKRIVGLPGETVEIQDGKINVYNEKGIPQILNESDYLALPNTSGDIKIKLADNEYFVLGDNRLFSSDSRRWGPLPEKDIIGRVFLRAWPFTALAKIETPNY
jgi:signal peptidase I